LEGFVRQVIGWREFMYGVYDALGETQRQGNFWDCQRDIPDSFYAASTGIAPVDTVIRRVMDHSYCHHIERLMVLGNFMLLCEIRPDQVYQWFMELFIDAYDWVMVPNVYGMSQYADGGLITTKPYISSSNYIRKMSDFPKGPWCDIWDGLFWRFVHKHKPVFAGNPRMRMMAVQWDRMDAERRKQHLQSAKAFLRRLFG
jgi:deoxyribodipyrimidine photolyase-related protein